MDRIYRRHVSCGRCRQGGTIMLIALIILVALTLAGLALVRSVDTGALIAGNVAFRQSALQSSDAGVELAVAQLVASQNNNNAAAPTNVPYDLTGVAYAAGATPGATAGYMSNGLNPAYFSPVPGTKYDTWDKWWAYMVKLGVASPNSAADASGNTYSYVIQRMCSLAQPFGQGGNSCVTNIGSSTNNCGKGAGVTPGNCNTTQLVYRITVRTVGPRSTASLVQADVIM